MSFYGRRILPWGIDIAMKNRAAAERRTRLLPAARGRVLEIGVGSGHNLAHYPATVDRVVGLDPSPELLAKARRRLGAAAVPVELVEHSAEAIPFDDGDFDTVVSTWTLCSIPDAAAALAEVRRVLKPNGAFLFVEHGRAPSAAVARWQSRLNPIWSRLSGGCNLDRPIDALVRAAGFRLAAFECGYLDGGPRLLSYSFMGKGRPA